MFTWDDTDIVRRAGRNLHPRYAALANLESRSTESLVIKLDDTLGPGFRCEWLSFGYRGRIGGSLQIVGQAGQPVVLTSLKDDTVGAGFDTFGVPLRDTRDGPSVVAGDWKGIQVDEYANDHVTLRPMWNVNLVTVSLPTRMVQLAPQNKSGYRPGSKIR